MTRDEIVQASRDEEGGMYIVIPSVVKLDAELPLSAQMLYGIITWKCNKKAYTWATNRELGEALGVSPKRASALLSLLEQRGHVETEIEYKDGTNEVLHRYIYPIMKSAKGLLRADPLPENEDAPIPENKDTPPSEKGEPLPENAEVICNIKKDLKNNTPYSPPEQPQAAGKRKRRRGKSVPDHKPERFEQFWAYYPGGGSRMKAVAAWDALAPDDALIDKMARALQRQMDTQQWREGIGIPHASTWLNQRRWTDKLPEAPRGPGGSSYWADDPEVAS